MKNQTKLLKTQSIPRHLRAVPGIERIPLFTANSEANCVCGKLNDRPHCPNCGSTNLHGFVSNTSIRVINVERMVCTGYRCMRCSLAFDEADRLRCEAPSTKFRSIAERKAFDAAQANLAKLESPTERKELLERLLLGKGKEGE